MLQHDYNGVDYLSDLLSIPRVEAEVLIEMGQAHGGWDNLPYRVPCGAAFARGGKGPFTFCDLPTGHRGEHDWAWMLSKEA